MHDKLIEEIVDTIHAQRIKAFKANAGHAADPSIEAIMRAVTSNLAKQIVPLVTAKLACCDVCCHRARTDSATT